MSLFATKVQVCSGGAGLPSKAHAGSNQDKYAIAPLPKIPKGAKAATFAGGCFWCVQPPFDKLDGVLATSVGFTGGLEKNPTYKEVAYGRTSHTEALFVVYDPKKVSYQKLLDTFWRQINPNQKNGQFADVGNQYRTGIFYHDKEQKKQAEASKKALAASGCFPGKIEVEVTKFEAFYPAENYHQKYYKKNPFHYMRYKIGSGRAGYIKKHWNEKGCQRVK
ncbi:MAG: peptide-methionine (S)-S-oxide reductase MsrA [Myxococcales bacterium]|nr:peptide-methionine (S)-S-oxide reductase MsrA [Myxococcales bacterium]